MDTKYVGYTCWLSVDVTVRKMLLDELIDPLT
jgi:hypothetical protein